MASLKVKIGADASQFERTMRGVKSSIGGVKSSILGVAGATGALMAVSKAFDLITIAAREAFGLIKDSSQVAASIENLEVQFRVLLGSTTAAKERMEELQKFAASTPFTIPDIAAASKQLQTYGGDLLATGEGLRIVGDAAAVSGVPLQQVAMHAGRLFSALKSGKTAGEALTELQQMGLISAEARARLEELSATQTAGAAATEKIAKATKYGKEIQQEWVDQQKAGKAATLDASGALDVLREALSATEGGMAMLAETTDGKMSMVQDAIFQVKNAFGTGFNEGLKDALDATTEFIPKFKEHMTIAGQMVGMSISDAVEGDLEMIRKIGELIGLTLKRGIDIALTAGKQGVTESIFRYLEHGGFKKGGILPKGFTDTMISGFEASDIQATNEFNKNLSKLIEELKQMRQDRLPVTGSNTFGMAQDMMSSMLGMFQGLPQGNGPFAEREREIEILSRIERHLAGD